MTTFTVPAIFKAVNQVTAPVRKMQADISGFGNSAMVSMQKASISMTGFNRKVDMMHAKVRNKVKGILGQFGSVGAAIGLLAIGSFVVNANIEADKSFASLSAITGKTGKEFESFKVQVDSVARSQKKFKGDTAKAFEIVASAQPILLENARNLGIVTNAAITLSKASGDDLENSALSLTGVMNQFSLSADQASRVMNVLAAGSVEGSANITNIAESMVNFGSVASGANMSVEQTVALIEALGSKSLFGAEAGTKLRGSILKLQQAGIGYASGQFNINDALTQAKNKMQSLSTQLQKDAYLNKLFGAENISTGRILLNNTKQFETLTNKVTGTDWAIKQAAINSSTFSTRLNEIKDSFKNNITATGEQSAQMEYLKTVMGKIADNMDKIISTVIVAAKLFVAYKVATIGLKIAQIGLNTAIGISNIRMGILAARTGIANIAIGQSAIALNAYTAASWFLNGGLKAAIASTWAFNVALWSNPITWIVIGIMALIAAIVLLIVYWQDIVKWVKESDNWFAKLLRGSLKPIMWVIDGISGAWKRLKEAFKSGGLMDAIKSLGRSILSFLLAPIEGLLIAINKVSGGKLAGDALAKIQSVRSSLTETPEVQQKEVINPSKGEQTINSNNRVDLYINNRSKNNQVYTEGTGIMAYQTGY